MLVQRKSKDIAKEIGFNDQELEEIAIITTELATNLLKHCKGGQIIISSLNDRNKRGIQIESIDTGPGVGTVKKILKDGFSTAASLGTGLGAINRLADKLIVLPNNAGKGSRFIAIKWLHDKQGNSYICPLDIGAFTRPKPSEKENGDDFIIKYEDDEVLVAVIDGLGHGPKAHLAAIRARHYIENHHRLSLKEIFLGTHLNCLGTRGVVMALAKFNWSQKMPTIEFCSVGNISVRVFGNETPINLITKRGVIGNNLGTLRISKEIWDPKSIMILHSDGIMSGWSFQNLISQLNVPAQEVSKYFMRNYARENDDATIVIIKGENYGK